MERYARYIQLHSRSRKHPDESAARSVEVEELMKVAHVVRRGLHLDRLMEALDPNEQFNQGFETEYGYLLKPMANRSFSGRGMVHLKGLLSVYMQLVGDGTRHSIPGTMIECGRFKIKSDVAGARSGHLVGSVRSQRKALDN